MTILMIFAIFAAVALVFLLIFFIRNASPENRKAFALPGLIQLFAASIALVRGNVLPDYLPHEIVTILCYFFALYLTFTSAISIASSGKRHGKVLASIWILAAIAFWVLAVFA